MASWSTRRKYGYFLAFIIAAGLVVGVPSFFTFYKPATCTDNTQNQGERGVDCGGPCTKLCPADYAMPKIKWSYSMKITPSLYNSLAYVENPNQLVQSQNVGYLFKLYDNQGILVAERAGKTFVPAGQKFAVFEGAIDVGNRIPSRTTFEFTSLPNWQQGSALSSIRTVSINVTEGDHPSAEARIENTAVDKSFANITAFIVLYDTNDNRVAFSKTIIDSIPASGKETLYFTWPNAFTAPIIRSELLFVATNR